MTEYLPPLEKLIEQFRKLPGVGRKSAARMAFSILDLSDEAVEGFSEALPAAPLHWMIADRTGAVTVECMKDGMRVWDNPAGVLTNNPPFDYHMTRLADFMNITGDEPENRFGDVKLARYSKGMGAIGLPGDLSSSSRFVRAAFTKAHSVCGASEAERISQFFHILSNVRHVRGSVETDDGYEITVYSSCCNTDDGIYYYTTYENSRITAVDMRRENLDKAALIAYPLLTRQDILLQN